VCTGSASRRSATGGRRKPPRRGADAERRAARWYRLRGWRILGANVWAGGNEIDLIVRRGRTLRFVEVKEKRGTGFGDPLEMITAEKRRRLRRAAAAWLAARPEFQGLSVGFDGIAVRDGRVRRLPQAF
jgi:putative endonuclease